MYYFAFISFKFIIILSFSSSLPPDRHKRYKRRRLKKIDFLYVRVQQQRQLRKKNQQHENKFAIFCSLAHTEKLKKIFITRDYFVKLNAKKSTGQGIYVYFTCRPFCCWNGFFSSVCPLRDQNITPHLSNI